MESSKRNDKSSPSDDRSLMRNATKSGKGRSRQNNYNESETKFETKSETRFEPTMKATNKMRALTAALCSALLFIFQGCVVGPHYNRPSVDTPGTFKEVTPDDLKKMDGWKVAQPQDSALHGKWWEIFGDPQLNALEEQVSISNQNVAAAFANFMAARALVREARAQYFPTLGVTLSATRQRPASNSNTGGQTGITFNEFSLP